MVILVSGEGIRTHTFSVSQSSLLKSYRDKKCLQPINIKIECFTVKPNGFMSKNNL